MVYPLTCCSPVIAAASTDQRFWMVCRTEAFTRQLHTKACTYADRQPACCRQLLGYQAQLTHRVTKKEDQYAASVPG